METCSPHFPRDEYAHMHGLTHTHTHTHTHKLRQAYVFLCLIRGNVKMTPAILKRQQPSRPWMKEMGGDDIYMHIVSAQPDRHTDETWSGGLGIPVSNSGKWFVILETRGMIQNQNEGHQGQQYLLRLHYKHTHHRHRRTQRFNLNWTLTSPHPRLWYPSPLLSFPPHAIQ